MENYQYHMILGLLFSIAGGQMQPGIGRHIMTGMGLVYIVFSVIEVWT